MSGVQNSNPWAWLGVQDYFKGLLATLPPGPACEGSFWQSMMMGFAQIFADVQGWASQLSEVETNPLTANALLPYWNLDYGLPDCCTPAYATVPQQQAALAAKIAATGGASAAYFQRVAAALGWSITVTPGSAGSSSFTITASATAPPSLFIAGASRAGDLVEQIGSNTQLECFMNRIKPAWAILTFVYV